MEKALYFANGIIYITELAVAIYLFVALVLFIFKWCQFVPVRSSAKIDLVEKLETKVAVQGTSLNKSEKNLLTEEKQEKQVSPVTKVKFMNGTVQENQEIVQDKTSSSSVQSDKVQVQAQPQVQAQAQPQTQAQPQPQTQTQAQPQAPRSSKSSNEEEKTRNSKSPTKPPNENDKMPRMSKTSNKLSLEERETEKTQRPSRMSQKLSLEERDMEKIRRISKNSHKLREENGNGEVNQDNASPNSKSKSPENREKP